jgi:hypothetical protein
LRDSSAEASRQGSIFPEGWFPKHQRLGIGLSFSKKAWNVPSIVLAISIKLEGMRVTYLVGALEACFHRLSLPTATREM